jgi:signal transduction histidine kinase
VRTRTRFALLFACIAALTTAIGVAAIYGAVGRDAARRLPAEAEAILGTAARRAIDGSGAEPARLAEATESIIAARALLAEGRVMEKDAIVGLALEVASILAAVMAAAGLAFLILSRLITRGLDDLASRAKVAKGELALGDGKRRFAPSSDPDIDAVARALNELLDLAADQERRLAEAARLEGWREVASFLAHQLKNPLAALRLAAQNGSLALASEGSGEASMGLVRESLGIMRSETARLAALIDRFRDLAPAALQSTEASARTELRSLLDSCAARAEISGAGVVVEVDPSEIWVAGDRGLLEQAFWNLFANSLEAGKGGAAGTLRIAVRARVEGGEAAVLLSDSNRGFDAALLPRLGRERVTTKAEGTGLGLVLVRRILAAQGGSLELFATEADAEGRRGLGARALLALAEGAVALAGGGP